MGYRHFSRLTSGEQEAIINHLFEVKEMVQALKTVIESLTDTTRWYLELVEDIRTPEDPNE